MATHSNTLAWRIPGTGEPGWLLSMGLHRVRHDWSDLAAAAAEFLGKSVIQVKICGGLHSSKLISTFLTNSASQSLHLHIQKYILFQCVVQSLNHVQLFESLWTAALQASLFFTISLSFLKLMSSWVSDAIQPNSSSIAPFSPCPQFFPASGSFLMRQLFASGGQSIGALASVHCKS